MSEWEGQERRGMNQDQRERDRLLTETHSNVSHLLKSFDGHVNEDRESFDGIRKDMEFQKKVIYGCVGVFVFLEFVVKFIK